MSVTLHTSLGDLKIELFCDQVTKPTTVNLKQFKNFQNFLGLCASGYYGKILN
jgi:peptidyl-prolyl cis-trans isomerase-like 3